MSFGHPTLETWREAVSASEERIRRDIAALRADITRDSEWGGHWQHIDDSPAHVSLSVKSSVSKANSDAHSPSMEHAASEAPFVPQSSSTYAARHSNSSMRQYDSSPAGAGTVSSRVWRGWPGNILPRMDYSGEMDESLERLRSTAAISVEHALVPVPAGQFDSSRPTSWIKSCWNTYHCATIQPDTAKRMSFDIIAMFVLMFDIIYTPLYLTWDTVVSESVALALVVCTTCFWTCDLCLNFVTGYHTVEGAVEMRFFHVARRYLRTWFLVDVSCVIGDFVNIFPIILLGRSTQTGGQSRIFRVLKLAKFLRVLGMVRMLRIVNAVNVFMEAELSEAWRMMVRIFQFSALLVWLGHICACAWYAVGSSGPDGEVNASWIQSTVGIEEAYTIKELSPRYQYVTSYQWGLAQLTLGAHDINPVNVSERLFTICCNLFGLLFGGTLISILSSTLIDLKEINQEKAGKVRALKEFLMQHHVDTTVRIRVLRQVRERVKQRGTILVEKDVMALQVLSETLLRDLRYCLYAPYILAHQTFLAWTCIEAKIIKKLCTEEVTLQVYLPEDELFQSNKDAVAGYHVVNGKLEYKLDAQMLLQACTSGNFRSSATGRSITSIKDAAPSVEVLPGTWISEAAWWCCWKHAGLARMTDSCMLISITHRAVADAALSDTSLQAVTVEYAKLFHQRVTQASEVPTDLHVQYSGFTHLLVSMPEDVHIILGMSAIEQVATSRNISKSEHKTLLTQLSNEVREQQTMVLLDQDGNLQRHFSQTVLRISRTEYHGPVESLMQLARYDKQDQKWNPACRLPSVTQQHQELPGQALMRLLDQSLLCIAEHLSTPAYWAFTAGTDSKSSSLTSLVGSVCSRSTYSVESTEVFSDKLVDFAEALELEGLAIPKSVTTQSVLDLSLSLPLWTTTQLMPKEELLLQLQRNVMEVYILGGTAEVGIYAWMDDSTFKALCKHDDVQKYWIGVIADAVSNSEVLHQLCEKVTWETPNRSVMVQEAARTVRVAVEFDLSVAEKSSDTSDI